MLRLAGRGTVTRARSLPSAGKRDTPISAASPAHREVSASSSSAETPAPAELVAGSPRHGLHLCRGRLQVEQDAVGAVPVPERLVLRLRGGGEGRRPLGQLEHVAVPVQGHEARRERAEKPVGGGSRLWGDGEPAHFLCWPRRHPGAKRRGEELAAEAHPEQGCAGAEGRLDQPQLVTEVGVLVGFVRAHRATQDYETACVAEVSGHRLAKVDAGHLDGDALALERDGDEAGPSRPRVGSPAPRAA